MLLIHKLRYPKFIMLGLTFVFAYLLFNSPRFSGVMMGLKALGVFGVFVLGIGYSYGFTAGPATAAIIVIAKDHNIFLFAIIAGIGSLLADLILFEFIRSSFSDEINKLFQERPVRWMASVLPCGIKKFVVPVIASIILASPLPDEIGVTMFAAYKNISEKAFLMLCYLLNTAGILIILAFTSQI